MRPRSTGVVAGLCLAVLGACGCGEPELQFTADAERILETADAFYRQRRSYRVQSQLESRIVDRLGQTTSRFNPVVESRSVAVRAPGQFLLAGGEFRIASDGQWLRVSPVAHRSQSGERFAPPYWRTAAPQQPVGLYQISVAPLAGRPENIRPLCLIEPGLSAVYRSQGEVVGTRGLTTVGDRPAHHLVLVPEQPVAGRTPLPMTEIWIAAAGDPEVLKIRYTPAPGKLQMRDSEYIGAVVSTETFDDWRFDEDEPAETFAAPAGGRRVGELGALVRAPDPLLGQVPPDLTLPLADGGTASLAVLSADRKIVLLDFWATWCGPCRMELPLVAALAEEFADHGVVMYGVNQQESPSTVAAFLREQPYRMQSVLDETGAVGNAFGVQSLPQLCILGRDGTVQAVHVGIGQDTEQAIREEIEALIGGRNIVADGLPE